MSKVSVEDVVAAMKQVKIEPQEKIDEVMKVIAAQLEVEKAEKDSVVKQKSKTLLLASVVAEGQEITETPFWIFKVPEEFDHTLLESTVSAVILDFKATGTKKAGKIDTIGDGILYVPASYWKARNLTRVTKEPVLVQKTNNVIPGVVPPQD